MKFPEVVDHLKEILSLAGFVPSSVNVLISHCISPFTTILLTGANISLTTLTFKAVSYTHLNWVLTGHHLPESH